MSDENLARLRDIYYDAETGFKGADETYKQAKAAGLTTGAGKLRHKDVKDFLKKQESRQVTKQFKRPTRFTSIRAKAVGEKYQTDLLEFGYKRNGYRFLLQVIDIHSRYAWSVLLPKGAFAVSKMMDSVISQQESFGLPKVLDEAIEANIRQNMSWREWSNIAQRTVTKTVN